MSKGETSGKIKRSTRQRKLRHSVVAEVISADLRDRVGVQTEKGVKETHLN